MKLLGIFRSLWHFSLKKTHKLRGKVKVIGKRVNRGAGCGLEVPTEYLFYVAGFNCTNFNLFTSYSDEVNFDR